MVLSYQSVEVISKEEYIPTSKENVFYKDDGAIAIQIDADHVVVFTENKSE